MKILILGGYGIFGGRLAQLLVGDQRLTLFIAGRSKQKAQDFCNQLASERSDTGGVDMNLFRIAQQV